MGKDGVTLGQFLFIDSKRTLSIEREHNYGVVMGQCLVSDGTRAPLLYGMYIYIYMPCTCMYIGVLWCMYVQVPTHPLTFATHVC